MTSDGSHLMYMAIDIQRLDQTFIVKVSKNVQISLAEYETLKKL